MSAEVEREIYILREMLRLALMNQCDKAANDYGMFVMRRGGNGDAGDAYEYMLRRCHMWACLGRADPIFLTIGNEKPPSVASGINHELPYEQRFFAATPPVRGVEKSLNNQENIMLNKHEVEARRSLIHEDLGVKVGLHLPDEMIRDMLNLSGEEALKELRDRISAQITVLEKRRVASEMCLALTDCITGIVAALEDVINHHDMSIQMYVDKPKGNLPRAVINIWHVGHTVNHNTGLSLPPVVELVFSLFSQEGNDDGLVFGCMATEAVGGDWHKQFFPMTPLMVKQLVDAGSLQAFIEKVLSLFVRTAVFG